MSQSTRSSMLLNFLLLTILALSSLGSTRPVSKSGSGLSRSDLHSRSASPRVIPSAGEYHDELVKDIFDALGLSSLDKLDDWKSKLEDSGVIDDSNSPTSTVTADHNASIVDENKKPSDDQQPEDTADDPVGFVDDVLSTIVDKFHEALLSQDEVTLV
ncbi:pyridoxal reductase [Aspergillus udagawae]|uniref:Pyridoxal reductase n=1 Tax=Aspergillus udagawae TaxID=91492 RepID=A0A8H3RVL2_9EURO|nr:uncharacterized protein Aud_008530 [Aspergillus udagawae]GFF39426.1 pyridoxal reductase [Aspergillus udagawae]GFF96628.1 pyridoxal reductase [Aspergillus udagawae]GFG02142.1 pyridoxal reductase [Aspergillus udagawae]GIC92073.1 hypothetical protein Aud_008530 [Aspergillus udagawae]